MSQHDNYRDKLGQALADALYPIEGKDGQRHAGIMVDAVLSVPLPMILHCPACHTQHIDRADGPEDGADWNDPEIAWTNPPHRSHLCHQCGHIWRPADVPTMGVAAIETKGKNDSADVHTFIVGEGHVSKPSIFTRRYRK